MILCPVTARVRPSGAERGRDIDTAWNPCAFARSPPAKSREPLPRPTCAALLRSSKG